jgi:hypothetical protein
MPLGRFKKCREKLTLIHQLLVSAADASFLRENIHTINEITETVLGASKEVGLEINTEKNLVYDHIFPPAYRTKLQYNTNY